MTKDELIKALQECDAPGDTPIFAVGEDRNGYTEILLDSIELQDDVFNPGKKILWLEGKITYHY
jgi:hypothetical protein